MDAASGFQLVTGLHALALLLSLVAIGISTAFFTLSRAGKVRAFEARLYDQLTNAASRIESIEAKWVEEKLHLETLSDEIHRGLEMTVKERKRLAQETKRAERQEAPGPNGEPDLANMSRADQLRVVRGLLQGGGT